MQIDPLSFQVLGNSTNHCYFLMGIIVLSASEPQNCLWNIEYVKLIVYADLTLLRLIY